MEESRVRGVVHLALEEGKKGLWSYLAVIIFYCSEVDAVYYVLKKNTKTSIRENF